MAKKMKNMKSGMISEDMSAPGNMPQNVVRKSYNSMEGATYNYESTGEAMYMSETQDMMKAKSQLAKKRY